MKSEAENFPEHFIKGAETSDELESESSGEEPAAESSSSDEQEVVDEPL